VNTSGLNYQFIPSTSLLQDMKHIIGFVGITLWILLPLQG